MSNEQFYQDLGSRHRLFYANWHRFVQLEGAWLPQDQRTNALSH